MTIAILTATFNRAHQIDQLYQSLLRNKKTFGEFKWYIMDDGSNDDTEKIINTYINDNLIEIEYYKQKNQGKMTAINNLADYVSEDIIIEVDSDDYLTDGALDLINKDYQNLPNGVYGVLYYSFLINHKVKKDLTLNGKIITLFDMHYKYGYDYDMAMTFKADIRKKYKYELVNSEKFITEARTYYKMDQDYQGLLIRCEDIKICEYQTDGYTNNLSAIFKKYPYGYYHYFLEMLNYPHHGILFKKRIYMVKQYILFSVLTKKKFFKNIKKIKSNYNRILIGLLYIPGYIMTLKKMR